MKIVMGKKMEKKWGFDDILFAHTHTMEKFKM